MLSAALSVRGSPTREIDDLVERSVKKKKIGDNTTQSDGVEVVPETPEELRPENMLVDDGGNEFNVSQKSTGPNMQAKPSYLQSLTGEQVFGSKGYEEAEFDSDDDTFNEEDEDKDCPTICLTKEEKRLLRAPWKMTLIIKLWGRTVGYNFLLRKLQNMWRPTATMDLVALENEYFLVRFSSKKDYEYAKLGGPWMILDHYLVVKEWYPNFDPLNDKTEKLIVWVRIPCLPIEYFNFVFLKKVGKKIGRPIRADFSTDMASRGKFARMCVEVDITKPLLAKFKLKNRVRRVEYEGIHLVCFGCGMYGHKQEECPKRQSNGDKGGDYAQDVVEKEVNGETYMTAALGPKVTSSIRPEVVEDFGPWMLAQRKQRKNGNAYIKNNQGGKFVSNMDGNKRIGRQNSNIQKEAGVSTRFNALYGLEDNEEIQGVETFHDLEEPQDNGNQSMRTNIQGKGKRPQVQVSEKQIENDKNTKQPVTKGQSSEVREESSRSGTLRRSKQAAAEAEHVVVRGSQGGKSITRTVVETEGGGGLADSLLSHDAAVHHQDPPFFNGAQESGPTVLMEDTDGMSVEERDHGEGRVET